MKKSTKRKIEKEIKKVNPLTIFLVIVFTLIGIAGGFFGVHMLTKNDTFELLGGYEIKCNVGDSFIDEGAKIIAFGKDISSEVIVEGNVDTSIKGDYVLKYKVNHFRYNGYVLYRLVSVVEVGE